MKVETEGLLIKEQFLHRKLVGATRSGKTKEKKDGLGWKADV